MWITDEIGQTVGRRYVRPTDAQRERARDGEVWPVVRELLDGEPEEAP